MIFDLAHLEVAGLSDRALVRLACRDHFVVRGVESEVKHDVEVGNLLGDAGHDIPTRLRQGNWNTGVTLGLFQVTSFGVRAIIAGPTCAASAVLLGQAIR